MDTVAFGFRAIPVLRSGAEMSHIETAKSPAPRRGLSRIDAAIYVGISPSKFDQMVADGRMPGARRIDGRKVWDVRELDLCFDDLPHADDASPGGSSWDDR